MAFQFLHAADLHLDSPLHGLQQYPGAPVEAIRGAARRALERLVQLAIDRRVAFVVIAGDLYDGDWRDYHTGLFFVQQARRLQAAGIPLYLISGNHDAQNLMTRTLVLPDNTRMLLSDRPETVILDSIDVAIHGQSFAKREVLEDLSLRYPAAVNGLFNIGVLHTSATGREGHEPYAPCSLEGLQTRNYDYWALGHIHKREVLCERPYVTFSGNIQGRHIRETGPKGCWLVSVDDRRNVSLQFEELDVLRWEIASVDVSGCGTMDDVFAEVMQSCRRIEETTQDLPLAVRVVLNGMTPLHDSLVAHREKSVNNIRASAGNDRVWIEKVSLHTKAPRRRSTAADEGSLPWEELLGCVAELRSDPAQASSLAPDVSDLINKLPSDLDLAAAGLNLSDSAAWSEVLDEVESLLLDRLSDSEVSP